MTQEKKKNGFSVFLDELSRSSFLVTLLAIVTGLLLGGILVAVTTIDVYTAMKVSLWEGCSGFSKRHHRSFPEWGWSDHSPGDCSFL
jgi:hypothetical protein